MRVMWFRVQKYSTSTCAIGAAYAARLAGTLALMGSITFGTLTVINAQAGDRSHMEITGLTSQPIGHYEYCKLNSSDCKSQPANPITPKLTREKWNDLVSINSYVNKAVIPVTDMEYYNREELWTLPGKYGDCEDYVLLKRKMLMERGWPVSSLLATVVRQSNGDGHAVLTVRTDRADYVLDNLSGKIKPWQETEYLYLKRQSTLHSGRWAKIRDSRTIVGAIKQ